MAYNYFPQNYQPIYPMQSNAYSTQSNAYPTQTNALIWVQGEAGAKSYMVAPNQTVVLWDSEAQIIYLKSADSSGMPNIKVLDYTIRDNTTQRAENQPQNDFATKDDVSALEKEIASLKAKFERMSGKEKKNV